MKSSSSVTNISSALLKAQKSMGAAKKDAKNPFFKSKYADLGAVLEACKDALNENGITILQPHSGDCVETILLHESGEWVSSETKIVVVKQNDPQALGSAISYARRYGLQSLISLPAEDDDAETAMSRPTTTSNVTKLNTPTSAPAPTPATSTSTFKKPANPANNGLG